MHVCVHAHSIDPAHLYLQHRHAGSLLLLSLLCLRRLHALLIDPHTLGVISVLVHLNQGWGVSRVSVGCSGVSVGYSRVSVGCSGVSAGDSRVSVLKGLLESLRTNY